MPKTKRSTPLKKTMLQLFAKNHLLSAPQLVEKLHEMGLPVNKTSVYRNLDSFLADNVLCQQAFTNEFVYELQEHHHDHLRCRACGKVREIPCQVHVPSKLDGYTVEHHHLTLFGLCQQCLSKSR